MANRKYPWKPSLPDHRDWKCKLTKVDPTILKVDLRSKMPIIYDQLQLGSCVDNAGAAYGEYLQLILSLPVKFRPSRLYLYYFARDNMGSEYVMQDSGSSVKDGVQSMLRGFCSEKAWGYSDDPFKFRVNPDIFYWLKDSAKLHKLEDHNYESVNVDLNSMKAVLQEGYPIWIGFTVYESLEAPEVAKTGVIPMPKSGEQVLGGHSVLIVGYDDLKRQWIVRNSWGTGWGDQGYCYFPYEYLANPNLAGDFWVIRKVS